MPGRDTGCCRNGGLGGHARPRAAACLPWRQDRFSRLLLRCAGAPGSDRWQGAARVRQGCCPTRTPSFLLPPFRPRAGVVVLDRSSHPCPDQFPRARGLWARGSRCGTATACRPRAWGLSPAASLLNLARGLPPACVGGCSTIPGETMDPELFRPRSCRLFPLFGRIRVGPGVARGVFIMTATGCSLLSGALYSGPFLVRADQVLVGEWRSCVRDCSSGSQPRPSSPRSNLCGRR